MKSRVESLVRELGRPGRLLLFLLLRSPYEACATILLASFLAGALSGVESGSHKALFASLAWFSIAVPGLYLYNGTVWATHAPFWISRIAALRRRLFRRVLALRATDIDARPTGDWSARLTSDVSLIDSIPLHYLAVHVVGLVVSTGILVRIDGFLALIVILTALPAILAGQVLAKPVRALSGALRTAVSDQVAELVTLVEGGPTARLYDASEWLIHRFCFGNRAIRRVRMRLALLMGLQAVGSLLVGMGGTLVVLSIGALMVLDGRRTLGGLVALLHYRLGVVAGASMVVNCLLSIRIAMAGADRVMEVLDGGKST